MLSIRAAARTSARIAMPSRLGALASAGRAKTCSASFSTALRSSSSNSGGNCMAFTRASTKSPSLAASPRLAMLSSRFSTATAVRAASSEAPSRGEIDKELSDKLESELSFEKEMAEQANVPASIKDFLANCPFQLEDKKGRQEVKLVRDFGDEKITVAFSIAEAPVDDPYDQDDSFGDEGEDGLAPASDSESGGNKGDGSAPAAAEGEEGFDEGDTDLGAAPPVHFTVTIEKPNKTSSVLTVECTAQDGQVVVDDVHRHSSAAEAFASDSEALHRRAERYAGPSFATLDEDLQVLVENYLEERGITPALAVFMPDYVDFKEQKEYVSWLKDVKAFVDA